MKSEYKDKSVFFSPKKSGYEKKSAHTSMRILLERGEPLSLSWP